MNSNKKGRIQRPPTSFFKSENTDEIASYEVSYDYADIHSRDLHPMRLEEGCRYGKVIESVSHAVRETADDE